MLCSIVTLHRAIKPARRSQIIHEICVALSSGTCEHAKQLQTFIAVYSNRCGRSVSMVNSALYAHLSDFHSLDQFVCMISETVLESKEIRATRLPTISFFFSQKAYVRLSILTSFVDFRDRPARYTHADASLSHLCQQLRDRAHTHLICSCQHVFATPCRTHLVRPCQQSIPEIRATSFQPRCVTDHLQH